LVRDLSQYAVEWNESFEFEFVSPDELTRREQRVYCLTPLILRLAGSARTQRVNEILISETMRPAAFGDRLAVGVWVEKEGRIVIKRSQLCDLASYASTLMHEIVHAATGSDDLSPGFEEGLTELLGVLAVAALPSTE
jgi:hypothetical protein